MSDVYCPPPEASDYLESGIPYPDAEGKEKVKSTNPDHNDISYDDPKVGKSVTPQTNIEDDLMLQREVKRQPNVESELRARSVKSVNILRASGDRSAKIRRPIYRTQSNTLRKVVNEI